jgi:uncharacterized protein YbjT (DUF2867 family)
LFVRNEAKARSELGADVKLAVGDIADAASLQRAVAGHERLFLLTNEHQRERELARVALGGGVKHIVKISCVFASTSAEHSSVFYTQGRAEADLVELKAPATILRPHDFMHNIFNSVDSVKRQGALYSSLGNTALASIDVRDIADCAATILTDPIERWVGTTLTLTGPAALNKGEVAALLSDALGKPVKHVAVDDATYFKTLEGFGLPRPLIFLLVHLSERYRLLLGDTNRWVTGNVEIITGRKPRSYAAFLAENKAAFL